MTLSMARRLTLVGEQSAALLAAASAAELGARVPSCPEWTVRDLVSHHGDVLRGWTAVIAAGAATAAPAWMADEDATPPWEPMGEDWQPWYVASHRGFRAAVEAAGEDGPAWAWWQHIAPTTAGTIARHQVQEACIHRWDAQLAAGLAPDPLPDDAAAEGVVEMMTIDAVAEPWPWPGARTEVALAPTDGAAWLLVGDGVLTARPLTEEDRPHATVAGSASDLVLVLYERIPPTACTISGDVDAAVSLLA